MAVAPQSSASSVKFASRRGDADGKLKKAADDEARTTRAMELARNESSKKNAAESEAKMRSAAAQIAGRYLHTEEGKADVASKAKAIEDMAAEMKAARATDAAAVKAAQGSPSKKAKKSGHFTGSHSKKH